MQLHVRAHPLLLAFLIALVLATGAVEVLAQQPAAAPPTWKQGQPAELTRRAVI